MLLEKKLENYWKYLEKKHQLDSVAMDGKTKT